MEGVV